MLNLYSVFYLNLMFSSVAEGDRLLVIKKCYWPLLNLIERGFKVALQPSGITLEIIEKLDPLWIEKFKQLLKEKKCELIGEGYSHIIAPLVPAEVNNQNHALGRAVYWRLLETQPKIATTSEMAYSSGTLEHFLNNGYQGIMMDWNNSAQFHLGWKKEWKYHPQIVLGQNSKKCPVVWGNFVAFQKFQRYVNSVIELEEYLKYIQSHKSANFERFFMLYGSDAEIFDFRTRRFASRVEGLAPRGEWDRINILFDTLLKEKDINLVFPSEVLKLEKDKKNAFNKIQLESAEEPIPVKKQEKYNITRWGLTGNSVAINTACFKIYENIKNTNNPALWKELCYLWSSDFRTHIEKNRSTAFQKRLAKMLKTTSQQIQTRFGSQTDPNRVWVTKAKIMQTRRHLEIDTKEMNVVLNIYKGLTVNSLTFKKVSKKPLLGTLLHDFYDDVRFATDWFSGHSVIGVPGKSQMTNLGPVNPKILKKNGKIIISCKIPIGSASRHQDGGGAMEKTITFFLVENKIEINYGFNFFSPDPVSWRTGFVTLHPEVFDQKTLFYACHNGGQKKEKFLLQNTKSIDVGPVSLMVSAPRALGNTKGEFEVGDARKRIIIKTNMSKCAALPMIHFERMPARAGLPGTFFLRSFFSLREIDDTTSIHDIGKGKHKANFTMTISAEKTT